MTGFGKIYAKAWDGSLIGAGSHVFAVLSYAIAKSTPPDGQVELNPRLLAFVIGDTEERIEQAIEFLCSPDPRSRSDSEEGRRLIRLGQFLYKMVNFKKYRDGGGEELLRMQWRVNKRNQRSKRSEKQMSSTMSETVRDNRGHCPQAEAEAEAKVERERETETQIRFAEQLEIPEALQTPEFQSAWKSWLGWHFATAGTKLNAMTGQEHLRQCFGWGAEAATENIRHTIANRSTPGGIWEKRDYKPPPTLNGSSSRRKIAHFD